MIASVLMLIGRRLAAAIPILLVVSALLFCVLRVLPVDEHQDAGDHALLIREAAIVG